MNGAESSVGTPAETSRIDLFEANAKLREAEELRRSGQLDRAREICEALLRRYPDYYGALQTLSLALSDKGDYSGALYHLSRATMLNPKDWFALWGLSHAYMQLGAGVMAARILELAIERKPDDADLLSSLGDIYRSEREYELAADVYRRALRVDSCSPNALIGLGLTTEHLGELAEAAAAFEAVIEGGMHSIRVAYALSQLPAPLVKVDVLSLAYNAAPESGQNAEDFRSLKDFTIANAFEKAGRHAESWEHLVAANRAVFARCKDSAMRASDSLKALIADVKSSPSPATHALQSDECPLSLFILGPSRSGKTTMEHLVSVLDGVKRGYESPIATNATHRTCHAAGVPSLQSVSQLPMSFDDLYRKFYLEELRERAGSAQVFANTHPGRVFDAYRLGSFLPNLRFIFVKRDLDDIILRIFGKKYRSGNYYAYDLSSIREYVVQYYKLMDLLAERLPDITRVVHYEDVIADPAPALASAAELCGLSAPVKSLPRLGDDRSCAEPYRIFMDGSNPSVKAQDLEIEASVGASFGKAGLSW